MMLVMVQVRPSDAETRGRRRQKAHLEHRGGQHPVGRRGGGGGVLHGFESPIRVDGPPTFPGRDVPYGLNASPCCWGQLHAKSIDEIPILPPKLRSHRIGVKGFHAHGRDRKRERERGDPSTGMSVRLARSNGTGDEKDRRCRCRRQWRAMSAIAEPVAG